MLHLSDLSIIGSWLDAHIDSNIDGELDDLMFTGCDSFDLKLSGDELDLLLKLYICERSVSAYSLHRLMGTYCAFSATSAGHITASAAASGLVAAGEHLDGVY